MLREGAAAAATATLTRSDSFDTNDQDLRIRGQ